MIDDKEYSFEYKIIKKNISVSPDVKKFLKKIKLRQDENIPGMNVNSYWQDDTELKIFLNKKIGYIFSELKYKISNCWVQKYAKNSYHTLHTHNGSKQSFVWFIEGDKNSSPIRFLDVGYPLIDTGKVISIDFVPGTFLMFSSFLPHEVLPNKNNNRLIVGGNVD